MVTAVMTVFIQGLSRSTATAIELLGRAFGGIVVSNRFSTYNHPQQEQRQLCWTHLIRELPPLLNALAQALSSDPSCWRCSKSCVATGIARRRERSTGPDCNKPAGPSARPSWRRCSGWWSSVSNGAREHHGGRTVGTCRQILQVADALWAFLECCGIEPTDNATERALRQSVIQGRISHGVHSRHGAICRSQLLTFTTTLRQQSRDVWPFLEQAWGVHPRGGVMPSLLPDP